MIIKNFNKKKKNFNLVEKVLCNFDSLIFSLNILVICYQYNII